MRTAWNYTEIAIPILILTALAAGCFFGGPLWAERVRHEVLDTKVARGAADEEMDPAEYAREMDQIDPQWRSLVDPVRAGEPPPDGVPVAPNFSGSLYLLGSDAAGRDVLCRVLIGGRNSLLIAFVAAVLTTIIGFSIGMVAGYFGGWIDETLCRGLDLLWAFPVLLLGMALSFALNDSTSAATYPLRDKVVATLVIALVYVPYMARPVRAEVLSLRERDYVKAAQVHGANALQVIRTELLPHLRRKALELFPLFFANAVQLEAVFSFLGVGVQRPEPSWGNVIADGRNWIEVRPHIAVVPGLLLFVTTISFVWLSDVLAARGEGRDRRRN